MKLSVHIHTQEYLYFFIYISLTYTMCQTRSGSPLFHLRGMQVVEQPRGVSVKSTTNIAVKEWSGFPAMHSPAQTNEWLIVNYMVSNHTIIVYVV